MRLTRLFFVFLSQLPISASSSPAYGDESSIQYPDIGAYRFRFDFSRRCLSGPIKLDSQDGYGMSLRSTPCITADGLVTDQHFFIPDGWNDSSSDPDTGPFRLIESRADRGRCVTADHGLRPMYANCMRYHADSWHIHAVSPGHVTIELPETGRCLVDEERSDYIRMGDCSSPRAVMTVTQVSAP